MILPLNSNNTILSGIYNHTNRQSKIKINNYQSSISNTRILGVPKAYINFGSKELTDEELEKLNKETLRRKQIAQYCDYLNRQKKVNIDAETD